MCYKKEVIKMYYEIAEEMSVKAPKLKFIDSRILNGAAYKNKITLSNNLAKLIYEEPIIVSYIITHEFVHFKNKDVEVGYKFTPTYNAYSLIQELRASIEGYNYNDVRTESEILVIEQRFKKRRYNYKFFAYMVGYPTNKQIAYYASRYEKLTVEVARQILEDYCKYYKIKRKNGKSLSVMF